MDGRSPTADVAAQFIKPNDRLTSFERLQIYNQQYWWRLLGSFRGGLPRPARGARAAEVRPARRRLSRAVRLAHRGRCATSAGTSKLSFREHPGADRAARAALARHGPRGMGARDCLRRPGKAAARSREARPRIPNACGSASSLTSHCSSSRTRWTQMLGRMRKRNIETDSASNAVSAAHAPPTMRLSARRVRSPSTSRSIGSTFRFITSGWNPLAFGCLSRVARRRGAERCLRDGVCRVDVPAGCGGEDPGVVCKLDAVWVAGAAVALPAAGMPADLSSPTTNPSMKSSPARRAPRARCR